MNIILIGMPGCGKSTVGVILAKLLGYAFVDTDLLLQQNEKNKLCDIITERGLQGFLKAEEKTLLSIDCDNTVISTGGSAIYSESGMQHLTARGKTVFLRASLGALRSRLSDLNKRGVAGASGKTLDELFEERQPLYEKYADVTVCSSRGGAETVARHIADKLSCIVR